MFTQRRSISAVCGTHLCRSCSCRTASAINSAGLGLHPRRHERGQVQPRAPVQQQLLVNQPVNHLRFSPARASGTSGSARDPTGGCRPERWPSPPPDPCARHADEPSDPPYATQAATRNVLPPRGDAGPVTASPTVTARISPEEHPLRVIATGAAERARPREATTPCPAAARPPWCEHRVG